MELHLFTFTSVATIFIRHIVLYFIHNKGVFHKHLECNLCLNQFIYVHYLHFLIILSLNNDDIVRYPMCDKSSSVWEIVWELVADLLIARTAWFYWLKVIWGSWYGRFQLLELLSGKLQNKEIVNFIYT